MKNKSVLINVSVTFLANIVSLLVSLFSTLFIPKFISTNNYGYWQLYLFYISYAGILHLGLADGIYLTNGGKEYCNLNFAKLRGEFYSLIGYLFIFCFFIGIISQFLSVDIDTKNVIIFTCFGAFIHVLKTFLLMILQSTNRLKEYSIITIVDRAVFITLLIVCLFVIGGDVSYKPVIACDIVGRILSLIFAVLFAKDIVFGVIPPKKIFIDDLISNIQSGSSLLIAGIASNLIVGIVRYAIKQVWNIDEFAKISLSLSVINMILSFINMAAIVFFPILKRMNEENQKLLYKEFETVLIVFSFGVLCFAGIAKWIISLWLPQYSESLVYMIFLLPICVFESETSMLLNTYLKAIRFEKTILKYNLISVCFSCIVAVITTVFLQNIFLAIMGILFALAFRDFSLKSCVYKYFNLDGFKNVVLQGILLLSLYILAYKCLNIIAASIIYLFIFILFYFVNKKNIKPYIMRLKNRM